MTTHEQQFAAALAAHGLNPAHIVGDGKIHRFDGAEDKPGKKSAWYVLHLDQISGAAFGDWKAGIQSTWCSKDEKSFTIEERDAWRKRLTELRATTEAERKATQSNAATRANSIWTKAKDATATNPYCASKKVKPFGLKEFHDKHTLIIPIRTAACALVSLQFIFEDKSKKFLTGGELSGCYYAFGGAPVDRLLIVEGFATGASLHEATGLPVAVAFNAGNLLPVAKVLRAKLPKINIIICADDDTKTTGNPGIAKATEAARAVNAALAVPDFGSERPDGATDFNDLAALDGLEAVRRCVGAAVGHGRVSEPHKRPTPQVILSRASEIVPEAIHWLWRDWLPAGKLAILAGQPGCGKTTIAISLAAALSRGGEWPDGTRCNTSANVLIWTGEDGLADTLVPRLMAAGADLSRVYFIESVTDQHGALQPFDPSADVEMLSEKIQQMGGASLLVVDPIICVVNGDSHKSGDVRKSLQPLIDLGAAHGCAILGITHFSKGSKGSSPTERILGSQAFGAAARMILIAGKDESSDRRIFAKSKCNIAGDTGGFEYAIEQIDNDGIGSSRIAWGQPIDGSAKEILRELETDEQDQQDADDQETQFEKARAVLYEWLRPFMGTKEMKAAAQAEGYSWRTIERAKSAEIASGNKIRAVKNGKEWGWTWDGYEAKYKNSTPPLHLVSTPPSFQLRQVDGGVDSLAHHDLQGKSANSAKPDRVAENQDLPLRKSVNTATPKTLAELADLTANPYPSRDSTPPSTPPSQINGGVDRDAMRGEL